MVYRNPYEQFKALEQISSNKLEAEKQHSRFLERLLEALYGSGWEYLTISKANEIRKSL